MQFAVSATGNRPRASAIPREQSSLFLAIAILAVAGFAVSAVSLQRHYAKSATAFCELGEKFNCDIVNRSEYSSVMGIPVAGIGIVGYGVLLALATVYRSRTETPMRLLAGGFGGIGVCAVSDLRRRLRAGDVVYFVFEFAGADCGDRGFGGSGRSAAVRLKPTRQNVLRRGLNRALSKQGFIRRSRRWVYDSRALPCPTNTLLMGKIQENNGAEASRRFAPGATGDLRLHEFRSRVFRNTRFLRVWLPPGYDDAENAGRRYPVFYLNDGQNLFEASTAFDGVEWQVDETADRLIREGVVPPMIIVGIDNTGKDRIREYMPHRSMNPMMLRVQGRHYPDFLMKEVMPFVERTYRSGDWAGEYWAGRIVFGCADCVVHGDGAAGSDWAIAAGEPVAVGCRGGNDYRKAGR